MARRERKCRSFLMEKQRFLRYVIAELIFQQKRGFPICDLRKTVPSKPRSENKIVQNFLVFEKMKRDLRKDAQFQAQQRREEKRLDQNRRKQKQKNLW